MIPRYEVVALGDCDVDIFVRVGRLPSWDEKVSGDLLSVRGGGVAANFSCAAAKLGRASALLATVGDDYFGVIARQSVTECGVDNSGVVVKPSVSTYFSFVALDERGEKALTIVKTDAFFPSWDDVDVAALRETRLIHIVPFDFEVGIRAAREAAAAGAAVSVDLEPAMLPVESDALSDLLSLTNVLFLNEFTVVELAAGSTHVEASRYLLNLGPDVVVVTRGSKGSYARTHDQELWMAAYPIVPVDTTGAGDSFNAAFIARWLDAEPIVQCLLAGTAAAALTIGAVGAREGLPGESELAAYLDRHEAPPCGPCEPDGGDFGVGS